MLTTSIWWLDASKVWVDTSRGAMRRVEATLTLVTIASWLTLHIVTHLVLVGERLIITQSY